MALSPGLDWKQGDKTLQLLLKLSAGRITWRRTAEQEETQEEQEETQEERLSMEEFRFIIYCVTFKGHAELSQ